MLLLDSVAQNFVFPLACLLRERVDPYQASSLFPS